MRSALLRLIKNFTQFIWTNFLFHLVVIKEIEVEITTFVVSVILFLEIVIVKIFL